MGKAGNGAMQAPGPAARQGYSTMRGESGRVHFMARGAGQTQPQLPAAPTHPAIKKFSMILEYCGATTHSSTTDSVLLATSTRPTP
jgi:hypothetical protein